jgi:hypothetical protein
MLWLLQEFAWESQLRFYWDRTADDCVIRQVVLLHIVTNMHSTKDTNIVYA